MPRKLTQDEFIKRAVEVHGSKYDYTKVEYMNSNTPVTIICPEHGEFQQTPSNHLQGKGCKRCGELRNTMTTEQFVEKAKEIHGDKYDYSKVKYINTATKVEIICPTHGSFYINPFNHINLKCGCSKCKSLTSEQFVEKAKEIHGNKYDYSKVEYVNNKTKVCIICPVHGEFWQNAQAHMDGCGCPKCSNRDKVDTKRFIEKARQIHGDKYDYNNVVYVNVATPVKITCPQHGSFMQTPNSHLLGHGCQKCALEKAHDRYAMTTEQFIEKAKEIHGDKYDYSKVRYINYITPVTIICPEHGEFEQRPSSHFRGGICPKCRSTKLANMFSFTTEKFINKAKQIHGNHYDYSKVIYNGYDKDVTIVCPEHGDFKQTPDSHLQGSGCQKCSHKESKQENELSKFVIGLIGKENVEIKKRKILDNPLLELDIYIPSIKTAIEYNGVVWHSEKFGKYKSYHLDKLNLCNKKGIKLIQIFEDEYVNNRKIVENKISHILGYDGNKERIQARKCDVRVIDSRTSKIFLNKNHIQGFANSSVHIGCYHKDKLVAVMSFRHEFNGNNWELTRFATNIDYVCVGVGGKLFKYFIRNYNPDKVKSFADRRWTLDEKNNLYTKLGFSLTKILLPDYRYVIKNKRIHKFNCRKNILIKKYPDSGLNENMTENEMCHKLNFYRIWDCGLYKFEYINKN